MNFSLKTLSLLVLLFISSQISFSQSNIGIKAKTLTINPFGHENAYLVTGALNKTGHILFEPGVILTFEKYIRERTRALTIHQCGYFDAAGQPAGYTHIGFRNEFYKRWKHSFSYGIGTSLHYRKTWENFTQYQSKGDKHMSTGSMQYQWMYLTGGLEYNYFLNKKVDFSVGAFYSHPQGFSFNAGFRFWISKKILHKKSCNC